MFAEARKRVKLAWHVLRGRPLMYRAHFSIQPFAIADDVRVESVTFDLPASVFDRAGQLTDGEPWRSLGAVAAKSHHGGPAAQTGLEVSMQQSAKQTVDGLMVGDKVFAPYFDEHGAVVALISDARSLEDTWFSGRVRRDWGNGPGNGGTVALVEFPYNPVHNGQERSSNRILLPTSALRKGTTVYVETELRQTFQTDDPDVALAMAARSGFGGWAAVEQPEYELG